MIPAGTQVHFVGVGGAGMSAIASVLLARGYAVSGSDLRESEVTRRLRGAGAHIEIGHAAEHVQAGQIVVISRAVPADNIEVLTARRRGVPVLHRAEMLAGLMEDMRSIAVVGTHGKTTTTSMIARILERAGRDLVAEVDESDGSLLRTTPQIAVVTSVDATDHLDFYGSAKDLMDTFRRFLDALPTDGLAVVCTDTPAGRWLAGHRRGANVTYGLEAGAAYTAHIQEMVGRRSVFEARRGDEALGQMTLAIPGAYNIQNALGALAVTLEIGVPLAAAAGALCEFRGVLRRFTVRGEIGGVLDVDDYAHNPTKVTALLQAARHCWPRARIIAVFQPHRYSRTRTVGAQFAEAFDPADEVIITALYAADEPAIPGVDSGIIVRAVAARRAVQFIADAAEVVDTLARRVRPGDLVLTIGAGDVWKIGDALVSRLQAGGAGMPGREAPEGE